MTVSDIAELAGVQRSTVSNWQRRHDAFPKPLPDSPPGRPQFDADAVRVWLAERYPERMASDGRAAAAERNWRYTVNGVQCDEPTDPLTLLIGAIQGERVTYWEGNDERYPMSIGIDDLDTTIYATRSQGEAIRHFLENELDDVDKADLVETAAQEFDDLGRWRRSSDAVAAENNLHKLLAGLVHEESETILDFACGTGALLASVARRLPGAKLVGIEQDFIAAFVADARLARRAYAEIEDGDILEVDVLAGRTFDAVVSIPPFGRKVDATTNERMRRLPFGPVRGSADAAWPQLAVEALAPGGEAFLVLPHSLLSDDRGDQVRRELVQQGLLAAIVTLPSSAHSLSKSMSDLWILSRRRDPGTDVLLVDFSGVDPSEDENFKELTHFICNWMDGPIASPGAPEGTSRFVAVPPIKLLGQRVNLDPLYWCALAATPTSAPELIDVVNEARASLAGSQRVLNDIALPDRTLVPDQPVMMTVRDARDEGLLNVIRRVALNKNQPSVTDSRQELPALRAADAEAMWRGDYNEPGIDVLAKGDPFAHQDLVLRGDVLVWATSARQVRATVCTTSGLAPTSSITVLRCGPELDPDYLALALGAGLNAVHATGSTIPNLRGLDLSFPLIPLEQQRDLASYAEAASDIRKAARDLASAAEAVRQALADAAGSGSVGITSEQRTHD